MSFDRAAIAAGLSIEETEILEDNEEFQREIEIAYACLERDLLERHRDAAEIQESRGGTHGSEWLLERLNPGRYSKTVNNNVNPNITWPTEIILKGRAPDAADN